MLASVADTAADEGHPRRSVIGGGSLLLAFAFALVTAAAFAVRLPLLEFETGDYGSFLSPWYDHIRERGFTDAMGEQFSDYTPPYLYLLALATHLPFSKVVDIKAIGLPFDVLLAAAVTLVVRERYHSAAVLLAVYGAVLLAPTVVWNGAMWGQCDAIFTSFAVLSLLFVLRNRPVVGLLMLGIAFAFKGQAMFIAPAYFVLTVKGRIPLRAWLVLPLPYLVGILPAWLLGRSFWDLLTNYTDQARLYKALVIGAPNIYQWLPDTAFLRDHAFKVAAVVIGAAMLAVAHPRLRASNRETVVLATMFALLCPFVLPRMHERYFFMADMLTIAYAFYVPRRWFLPALVITTSTYSYWPYLFGYDNPPVEMEVLTGLITAALAITWYDLWRLAREQETDLPAVAHQGHRVASAHRLTEVGALLRRYQRRLGFFTGIGVLCTVLYAGLFALARAGASALEANAIALALTMLVNFGANRWVTFRAQRQSLAVEAAQYGVAYVLGLALSSVALRTALTAFAPGPALETILALLCSGLATLARFILMVTWVFAERAPGDSLAVPVEE
jgi:Gpi18-like mannosyltransferase/putative flippase GtrA